MFKNRDKGRKYPIHSNQNNQKLKLEEITKTIRVVLDHCFSIFVSWCTTSHVQIFSSTTNVTITSQWHCCRGAAKGRGCMIVENLSWGLQDPKPHPSRVGAYDCGFLFLQANMQMLKWCTLLGAVTSKPAKVRMVQTVTYHWPSIKLPLVVHVPLLKKHCFI